MNKLLCLLLLPLQLLASYLEAFDLKEEVKKAQVGDYIVYAYKNTIVLFRVRENISPVLVVEEISAPQAAVTGSWQNWVSKNAPNHTSWTISHINTATGKLQSIFSVDEMSYQNANPAFQFLPTLFGQKLKPIDAHERKFVGPQPLAGEIDFRKTWLPKIMFESKEIHPAVTAYRVSWPADESELSQKPLDIYLASSPAITYLPYWIEVAGVLGKAKISALDSGKNLTSPISSSVDNHTYEQIEK